MSSPAYVPPGNSVREYSPSGRPLRSFGITQAGYGDLGNPGGIAVGPGGRIYVAQPDYGLVSVFSPAGRFYTEFGLQGELARAADDLEFPQDVAVAATGQVWVADSGHNRVVQFDRVPGAPVTGAPVVPSGPSWPLITGECLLALVIVALGWYLARRARSAGVSAVHWPGGRRHPAPAVLPPSGLTRRRLLTTATALSGVAAGTAVLPASLRRALAATLGDPPGGSLRDIEHIVILMQENRSFDHYFGTMPGVRGFADPAAVRLPDGSPVFRQPYPDHAEGYLAPFHLDTKATSAQATPGTDHSWPTQHHRAAVLRPAGRLPAVAVGPHAGRGRGRPADRAARGLRQPGPGDPGRERASPAARQSLIGAPRAPARTYRGLSGTGGSDGAVSGAPG